MTPKLLPLLELCIETGAVRGVSRAHKHLDNPSREAIAQAVASAIWEELHEWFDFSDAQMARNGDLPHTCERL